jgi:hypothetical protein
MLHKTYLHFSEETLKEHFVKSDKDLESIGKHISKYKKSIKNYELYESNTKLGKDYRIIRQIEKDETFWTASSLMTLFYSSNRDSELEKLLILAYGITPPLEKLSSWKECLEGEIFLFFEPNIPSTEEYLRWLKENASKQNFIPYILEKARNKKGEYRSDLEGATNVDAILINAKNGFAVFIEAKVLSDISYQISYDSMRNQIIRNLDVMSSANKSLKEPLNRREPDNTLFLLLTPKLFKDNPRSRLYGYTYWEYKNNYDSIGKDLPHRKLDSLTCEKISKRIGWITWEQLRDINSNCCKWLNAEEK